MSYTCGVECVSKSQYGSAVGYRTDTYALVTYLRVGIILAPLPHMQQSPCMSWFSPTARANPLNLRAHVSDRCQEWTRQVSYAWTPCASQPRGILGAAWDTPSNTYSPHYFATPHESVPRGLPRGTEFDTHRPNAS